MTTNTKITRDNIFESAVNTLLSGGIEKVARTAALSINKLEGEAKLTCFLEKGNCTTFYEGMEAQFKKMAHDGRADDFAGEEDFGKSGREARIKQEAYWAGHHTKILNHIKKCREECFASLEDNAKDKNGKPITKSTSRVQMVRIKQDCRLAFYDNVDKAKWKANEWQEVIESTVAKAFDDVTHVEDATDEKAQLFKAAAMALVKAMNDYTTPDHRFAKEIQDVVRNLAVIAVNAGAWRKDGKLELPAELDTAEYGVSAKTLPRITAPAIVPLNSLNTTPDATPSKPEVTPEEDEEETGDPAPAGAVDLGSVMKQMQEMQAQMAALMHK